MSRIEDLIRMVKSLEDELVTCMRCGMCQSVCPLYAQTGKETDVARGKLALLDGLMKRIVEDPQGVKERLDQCLLCGSCAAACPSGVHVLDIFFKARAILSGYVGLKPVERLILRGMLAQPALFDRLMEWGARIQPLFSRNENAVVGTSCARVLSPLIGNRHFVPLAERPFHRIVPRLSTPAGSSGLRVALFTGCLIDKFFPNIASTTLRSLEHHGVGVFLPEDQGCCGIPSLSSGDTDAFRKLVMHNVRRFLEEPFDVLVTSCATCTSTIRKLWPMMAETFPVVVRGPMKQLSEKTMDISAFLVSRFPEAFSEAAASADVPAQALIVTYHDPCHLRKSLGVFREPRMLLRAGSRRVREMTDADTCCGMGGSFNLKHYGISSTIGNRKAASIRESGASVLATGCPACMMQISDALSRSNAAIAVKHVIELYAETLESP
ncbi:MAG: (Fe-S)-binding protein [Thermodesulfobacteriota bacterium]